MSEFEGKADVQQIRVIALVMITVRPEPANGLNRSRGKGWQYLSLSVH